MHPAVPLMVLAAVLMCMALTLGMLGMGGMGGMVDLSDTIMWYVMLAMVLMGLTAAMTGVLSLIMNPGGE